MLQSRRNCQRCTRQHQQRDRLYGPHGRRLQRARDHVVGNHRTHSRMAIAERFWSEHLEATVMAAKLRSKKQKGFTLIETVISMVILTIGSVGLLGVFGLAVKAGQTSQDDMIARQLASEAMESIYTARNSSEISWAQIANVSNGGIFVNNMNVIKCAGPDGIVDTVDDASCLTASGATCPNGGIKCLNEPGADGIMGTADDVVLSL